METTKTAKTRISIFLVFFAAIILLIIWLWPIVMPFFIAMIFAYALSPVIDKITSLDVPQVLAIIIVYLYIFLLIYIIFIFCMPIIISQLKNLFDYLPDFWAQISAKINTTLQSIGYYKLPQAVGDTINAAVNGLKEQATGYVQSIAYRFSAIIQIFICLVLTPILSFYMIREKGSVYRAIITWLPPNERSELLRVCGDVDYLLKQYIIGYLLVSVIMGLLSSAVYACIGLDYALALGIIIGIADLIPYFGPFIGAIPAVIVALDSSTTLAIITIISLLLLQQIESSVITPKIMGDKIGLHPLVTIFAVLAGGLLFGILGTILAVPIAATLILIIKYVYSRLVGVKMFENL